MAGFKYKPRTAEQLEKRAKQTASDFVGIFKNDTKTYTVKENAENVLRILPPNWKGAEHYGIDAWVHYGVGPDRAGVLCLAKHKNSACPVCELRAKLQAAGDEDEAKELRASKSVVMYVVDRDAEKEGVQAWRAPFSLDADIVKVSSDSRSGETFNIDDPDAGYDVFFDVEGKGMQRKYKGIRLARKPTKLLSKYIDYIEDNPLTDQLNWLDYDEISKLLGGAPKKKSSRDDDDEDDDRKPRSRRARDDDDEEDEKPARSRSRARDDDDEDDEPPMAKRRSRARDDDDEDEEPAPKKRRAAADDDEEDEKPVRKAKRRPADDDDDEDEEPAPKKKRRASDDDDDDAPFAGGKKVKARARDEEDEDEEDEEDEEPAPKKKKRVTVKSDDDDDDEDEAPRTKLRERLAARGRK